MSKIRYAVLVNDKTETSTSTTGTVTIDLPETGILTELYPQLTYTKAPSNDRVLADYDAVTKLELLVDGSSVVKSFSGQECRALIFYNGGPFHLTSLFQSSGGDTDSYSGFPLYLNRFAGDLRTGLDLSVYTNPQLKITYDTSQTSIDGCTYDAATSPSVKYNIMAKLLQGRPSNFIDKFCQSREIDSWTQAASTEHTTEIPRGYELYRLVYKCGYLNVSWTNQFNKLKLDFDNGVWVPLDMDHEHVAMLQKAWFPRPVTVGWWDDAASADTINLMVHQLAGMGYTGAGGSGTIPFYDMHECGLHDLVKYDNAGSAQTSQWMGHVFASGWGPMQTICIPMKELLDGDVETVPTTDFRRIDLKITTGSGASSSSKGYVVAEYLKPNGG